MIRRELQELIQAAVEENDLAVSFSLSPPLVGNHGDYATSLALSWAKKTKEDPLALAQRLKSRILGLKPAPALLEKIEVAPPGFVNFFLSPSCLQKEAEQILKQGGKYGCLKIGRHQKVQVEFISANPTGPLTVGNARGGFWGDVLGNVLKAAGFKVEKAYYVNDYGMQVMTLGHSVLKDDQAKYKGGYVDWLHQRIGEKDPYRAGEAAARLIVEEMIRRTVAKMGIEYDEWISETWLHQSKRVEKALALLEKKDLTYEKDAAVWFKSSQFGDQRDRVIVKKDEWKTYLAGDAGLHYYKFNEKKFDRVINIWGADHYGDVPGLMAVVEALGHPGKLEIILLQFVTLIEKGQELKMSKRAGVYVTMEELLEMVGLPATRFFFLQKSADTHLNFDVDLAREQSEKNPVYYVQYAHARICSILAKVRAQNLKHKTTSQGLKLLNHLSELALIKQLIRFPEVIEDSAQDYQIQRLPQYALDLAAAFHRFYRDCRVIDQDPDLTQARLSLLLATQTVLKNALALMGIPAPEKM
ncbi:MAG: arginine--tRNA ligase [Candidatus Nealsonbacteria bacterium]|nr:arginine--tRNA ligase [Candidatus Nealsonbacteria bacterium]